MNAHDPAACNLVLDGDTLRPVCDGETIITCGSMTMTIETAHACGLLPRQILNRRRTDVAVLEAYGHGDTAEAHVLRADVAVREESA